LYELGKEYDYKITPVVKDNKLLSIKCRFGRIPYTNKYRYYFEFHDSLLMLLSSLDKLSKTFLADKPHLQKEDNREYLDFLLYERTRDSYKNQHDMMNRIEKYCIQDCVCLAHIIEIF